MRFTRFAAAAVAVLLLACASAQAQQVPYTQPTYRAPPAYTSPGPVYGAGQQSAPGSLLPGDAPCGLSPQECQQLTRLLQKQLQKQQARSPQQPRGAQPAGYGEEQLQEADIPIVHGRRVAPVRVDHAPGTKTQHRCLLPGFLPPARDGFNAWCD